jgi:RHS repeat-associated protein
MIMKNCILSLAAGLALALTGSLSAKENYKDTWYVSDHLATTVATIDVAGEIAQIEADAFGTPLSHDGTIGNPERYTGKPYDEDLGAYVFPFRNYRPEEGRWMSGDPSGFPDGVHERHYAPIVTKQIDPLGLVIKYETVTKDGVEYSLSDTQKATFESILESLRDNGGDPGQMTYDKIMSESYTLIVSNEPGEPGGGKISASSGMVNFDFTQSTLYSFPEDFPSQVLSTNPHVTVAHELGHALFGFSDPGNLVWENIFRSAYNEAARTIYNPLQPDIVLTPDIINQMNALINNLINNYKSHKNGNGGKE